MNYLENRIPPPIVAALTATIMWTITLITNEIDLNTSVKYSLTSTLFIIGVSFSIFGLISFRTAKTTINPLNPGQATSLVTSGIYQITRNPMYVGMASILCAWAVYLSSPWAIAVILMFIFYIHRFQIQPEEKALEKLFGESFIGYKNRVRPWL